MNSNSTFISKYKPYYIDDFYIDEKFKSVLKTLLHIEKLNIICIGNASSGKTTLLYALIREYYGLSKTQSFPENNIMFVNNLKEQGIQFYRNEMKTFAQSHSNIYGKKKLIIIDDIDMINEQSQQVFRNYIDKYKNNIHIITVCTNIQKVIESLQSRMIILRINTPTTEDIYNIMNKIIVTENITIDNESKEYLVKFSNNSIRTVITNLEKIFILGYPIDIANCKNINSNISYQQFETYFEYLKQNNLNDAIKVLYEIHDYGYSVIDIYDYLFTFIKQTEILTEDEKYKIIPVLCKYITVFHNIHEDIIELALFTGNLHKTMECL